LGILSVLDVKEKIYVVKAAPKDDKGDSDETKGCLGQVFLSDQAQHGK
jgi:hypothetical protein